MNIVFTKTGWKGLVFFIENDLKTVRKIKSLIESIKKTPFEGLGKPEALKYEFSGYYSRRINNEHRIIYKITESPEGEFTCIITQCRFHY